MSVRWAPDPLRLLEGDQASGRHRDAIVARIVDAGIRAVFAERDVLSAGTVARWLAVDVPKATSSLGVLTDAGVLEAVGTDEYRIANGRAELAALVEYVGHEVCMAATVSTNLMSDAELRGASAFAQQIVVGIEEERPDSARIANAALTRHLVACSRQRVIRLAFSRGELCSDLPDVSKDALETYRALRDALLQGDAEYVGSLLRHVRSLS
ncbi:hypothetical protein [Microbacterium flavum]|uniref:Transcriptional regulator n=1 Tax=Microbacterium flavum TaxID=415216 RepID=A0ABS5XTD8_9MICO|nr:hypothetical protein [Microbacterium flavum]MBT8797792.1 hypothetical protein [Microbacterium flavum]